jgi:hypothetical protein
MSADEPSQSAAQPRVTLETKCWEADWRLVLNTERLRALAKLNRFTFAERVLMINNVDNYNEVCAHADMAVARGAITRYIVVKEHAQETLRFFHLKPESFTCGYFYSIAELVAIYLCRTEFLLHFAGDCVPMTPCDWVRRATNYMTTNDAVRVANLTWNRRHDQAEDESLFQTDDFYVGYGFSDQCYLIRTAYFRAPIYSEYNPASRRYPTYGGELFEKRVDSWMRNNHYLRATYKRGSYLHIANHMSRR